MGLNYKAFRIGFLKIYAAHKKLRDRRSHRSRQISTLNSCPTNLGRSCFERRGERSKYPDFVNFLRDAGNKIMAGTNFIVDKQLSPLLFVISVKCTTHSPQSKQGSLGKPSFKHRKNCKCCPVSQLSARYQILS